MESTLLFRSRDNFATSPDSTSIGGIGGSYHLRAVYHHPNFVPSLKILFLLGKAKVGVLTEDVVLHKSE